MSVVWGYWKFKADAEKVYGEISSLGESYTPEMILEYAKNPDSELHKCFTWDDSEAARLYRLHEARVICESLKVVVEDVDESKQPRTFRIIEHDHKEKAYKPVSIIVRQEDSYARLLAQARSELETFRVRYQRLTELESVIEAIEEVLND